MDIQLKNPNWVVLVFFAILLLSSGFFVYKVIEPFFSIFIMASIIAIIFSSFYRFLRKFFTEQFSALTICLVVFIIIFIPSVLILGTLATETLGLIKLVGDKLFQEELVSLIAKSRVLEKANNLLSVIDVQVSMNDLVQPLTDFAKTSGLYIFNRASGLASNIIGLMANFFLTVIVVYFLLIEGSYFLESAMGVLPMPKLQSLRLAEKFKEITNAVIVGNTLSGLLQGIVGGLVFAYLGIKPAILWGVIMGVLAFLPVVGVGTIILPAIAYMFLSGRTGAGVSLIIFYAILTVFVEYFLKPKFVGRHAKMHILVAFFTIIGGLKVFGILGIFYGPFAAALFITLLDIYKSSYQKMVEYPEN